MSQMARDQRVFLSLGSNLGDRQDNLSIALDRIAAIPCSQIFELSSIFESEPVGFQHQNAFLNLVLELGTGLDPFELLTQIQKIESSMGRVRAIRWGPRLIDIDILLFGNHCIQKTDLIIPHPHLTNRRFVLEPLKEIAADIRVPSHDQTVAELQRSCKDSHWITFYAGSDSIYSQIHEEVL